MNMLKEGKHWIFYKFSHFIQIFYFFYLFSGCLIIYFETHFILDQYYRIPYIRFFCIFLFIFGITSFFLCSLSDPGKISLNGLDKHLEYYSYDEIIFYTNTKCKTCNIIKPARSKHCSYCSSCISRYDHHCFLLNNCIGGYNNMYYLVFLHIHIIITFYSTYITFLTLYSIIIYEHLLEATFINKENNEIIPFSYLTIVNYLFYKCSGTFSLFVISIFSFFCLFFYFLHIIYFSLFNNITQNELTKYRKLENNSGQINTEFYNKGFIKNVKDLLFYKKNIKNFIKKKL
ncbi:palmitoyltransferase DHHC12 [Plasmodium falciparum NF54]|uniref:Palmitoyltransferase n=3 Tax=Plasmodium falciparum TaxID=5833 RepID=A0A146M427_PLAF7|nr:palmitoyltransferase DHHC12, putative [Plasmodium falciparum 3D7]KAF4331403.1 palmitoyltransferase DHHC12 [Plasmodium falciparum NF54]PKC46381.1 palmitoyltransferase DHHC12 [Plasmodium falciparum NF54]CZT98042.1 palmitoyltransferase DHHC12, putative [Plasmodium falciparum 3D7]|eukprot:XP_024329071.1 palmitoyltransferase, putative [Plasmodium falciparum 3D7]